MGRRRKEETQDAENQFESSEGQTFAKAKGLPANEHAKKLAKEEAKKKKTDADKAAGVFYTLQGLKVIKKICRANGAYSVYYGNMKKNKDVLDPQIKQWKAADIWIDSPSEAKELAKKLCAEALAKVQPKKKG